MFGSRNSAVDEGSPRQCLRIVDLGFWGRTMMEIPGSRLGTRCTQLRVPSVEDPYVLLAIQYMIIVVFTGGRRRRIYVVSSIFLAVLCVLRVTCPSFLGCPSWLYICNRARVYKDPSRIRIRVFLLLLQVIFESLYLSTSLMGRARYTNPRVPEGHILVTKTTVASDEDSCDDFTSRSAARFKAMKAKYKAASKDKRLFDY